MKKKLFFLSLDAYIFKSKILRYTKLAPVNKDYKQ